MARQHYDCILWQPGSEKWAGGKSFGLNSPIHIHLGNITSRHGWRIDIEQCQKGGRSGASGNCDESSSSSAGEHLCHKHAITVRLPAADLAPTEYRRLDLRSEGDSAYLPRSLARGARSHNHKWLDVRLRLLPGYRMRLVEGYDKKNEDWSFLSMTEFHCLIQGHNSEPKLRDIEAAFENAQSKPLPREQTRGGPAKRDGESAFGRDDKKGGKSAGGAETDEAADASRKKFRTN